MAYILDSVGVLGGAMGAMAFGVSLYTLFKRIMDAHDIPRIRRELTESRLALADLEDRFLHYCRRQNTRRLREAGASGSEGENPGPVTNVPADRKAALRKRAFGMIQGKTT